jgi:nicotinate-nucleotide adenylyltransferase
MRVGLFGGSFDPPHVGHVGLARAAQKAAGLDRVLFAPVGLQPLKLEGAHASFSDRVAMTRLAIRNDKGFEVSLLDAPRNGKDGEGKPNYTIDVLEALRKELREGTELFLLMGADSFAGLRRWHRAAEIPMLAELIVASRPWEDLLEPTAMLPAGIRIEASRTEPNFYHLRNRANEKGTLRILPDVRYDVSATGLRGEMDERMMDGAVLAYVRAKGLYQGREPGRGTGDSPKRD